jgi:hypothetical protein
MRERAAVTARRERSCRTVRDSPAGRHLTSQRSGGGIERDTKGREKTTETRNEADRPKYETIRERFVEIRR